MRTTVVDGRIRRTVITEAAPGAPVDPRITDRSDGRAARRSRLAGGALVVVLFSVSSFAVWASEATAVEAAEAVAASTLSDDYARAATAVAAEESLERKYRLEPGPAIRTRFDASAAALMGALDEVRRDGDDADRALADRVAGQHRDYLGAAGRLFDAVDRGDRAAELRIDATGTDPTFGVIEQTVLAAAAEKHDRALAQLARLREIESLTRVITPLVFLAGLVLAALLASITRGHRRLLLVERARAVHDAQHDALTGLPNRVELATRLDAAVCAGTRAGTSAGLLLIDLDRFKEINDTFGHHYGDELLVQVGRRLAEGVRPVDTVARLGGDEFAVLLPGLGSAQDALDVASTVRSALGSPFLVDGIDLDVEASVGVVLSPDHGHDSTTLLQRADVAMYVAKRRGLGEFVYDPEADGHHPAKLAMLGDLRRALQHGELLLHYQPQVSVSSGEVTGVEALVRWQHPERGLIMPDAFMPLAEHTGLVGPLTRHILNAALGQVRAWAHQGRPRSVSVNLSARNLLDECLPDQIAELLVIHGVPPELLTIEVTESAIVTEPLRAQQLLSRLSVLGIGISIDDFGAGYTSLGQLKTLPVRELKIDRSFVTTMTEDRSNALIVSSVVDLGHNLGLTIVAEGVEDGRTLSALAALDCDIAQGYHLSRPVTADAVDAWCTARAQCGPNSYQPARTASRSSADRS